MKFLLPTSTFSLFLVASADATIRRKTMVLPATKECDPNQAIARMAASSSPSCGPNSHCVVNGNSSLGGYCHDNEDSPNMDMPEAMRILCFVCESPENIESRGSVVTKFDEIVGSFTCGELAEMGMKGKLEADQCPIFQKMIMANDLCGCTNFNADHTRPVPSVEEEESASESEDDESGNVYTYTNHGEINDNASSLAEEFSSPFGESGSSSKKIAVTSVTAMVVATIALAF